MSKTKQTGGSSAILGAPSPQCHPPRSRAAKSIRHQAAKVLALTGARELMIGRGVIRNPWLFRQIREQRSGAPIFCPTGRDLLEYVHPLYEAVSTPGIRESAQINNMKKYTNFIALGVEPTGQFLHRIRRATTRAEFFTICRQFLDHDNSIPLEPFPIALNPTDVMAGATR